MDSDLHFDSHINSATKSAYYHLKNVARRRGLMSTEDLEKLVHAFITSKLDYCSGLLTDNYNLFRMLLLETKDQKM